MRESGEMYLETILVLSKENKIVRAIDVAEEMKVSKVAVSRALSRLRVDGFVKAEKDGSIILTKSGETIAKKIYERHNVLTKMFVGLGVDEKNAVADACRVEHVISDKTFNAVKKYVNKTK